MICTVSALPMTATRVAWPGEMTPRETRADDAADIALPVAQRHPLSTRHVEDQLNRPGAAQIHLGSLVTPASDRRDEVMPVGDHPQSPRAAKGGGQFLDGVHAGTDLRFSIF